MKRRWMDFRLGHGLYLGYFISFFSFIVVTWTLFIERTPFLAGIVQHMTIYILAFLLVYPPLAVLMGHWHIRHQLPTEAGIQAGRNPEWRAMRRQLDRIERKLDEREERSG